MCQEFKKTTFATVVTKANGSNGIGVPIGQGKCKAVRLRINAVQKGGALPAFDGGLIGYYGDAQKQENELVALYNITAGEPVFYQSEWTPLIYCENLEEVFVARGPNAITFQVMILN